MDSEALNSRSLISLQHPMVRAGKEENKITHPQVACLQLFEKGSLLLIELLAEDRRGAEELSETAWQLFHSSSNKSSDYNGILVGTLTTAWNDYANRNASPNATGRVQAASEKGHREKKKPKQNRSN